MPHSSTGEPARAERGNQDDRSAAGQKARCAWSRASSPRRVVLQVLEAPEPRGQAGRSIARSRGALDSRLRCVSPRHLELVLERLKGHDASLTNALLDTRETSERTLDERQLVLRGGRAYPIRLVLAADMSDLRRALMAAQGNNPTRRIRLEVSLPGAVEANVLGQVSRVWGRRAERYSRVA